MTNKDFYTHDFAPIVLFAFKRPEHLSKTLTALASNPEFHLSPLFIYCDGAKHAVDQVNVYKTRMIANQVPHLNKTVIESNGNLGLAASVIMGVTQIVNKFGRVIVLEDDLIVDAYFLNFLNHALNLYENNTKIMQVSAYMFPISNFSERETPLLMPNISSWGWATWSRAWANFDQSAFGWKLLLSNKAMRREFDVGGSYAYSDMLFRQVMGEVDSWAILWNWSVYRCSGQVLYPPVTLVKNIGFDGSGTHCSVQDFDEIKFSSKIKSIKFSKELQLSKEDLSYIKTALKKLSGPIFIRILKLISNNIRRLNLKYKFS
jgi:hypothetical protein